jgi:hypothetical protein
LFNIEISELETTSERNNAKIYFINNKAWEECKNCPLWNNATNDSDNQIYSIYKNIGYIISKRNNNLPYPVAARTQTNLKLSNEQIARIRQEGALQIKKLKDELENQPKTGDIFKHNNEEVPVKNVQNVPIKLNTMPLAGMIGSIGRGGFADRLKNVKRKTEEPKVEEPKVEEPKVKSIDLKHIITNGEDSSDDF